MDYRQEYRQKLRTPEEAVRIVKDGDWVDYGTLHNFPSLLDAALAKRRDELHGVGFRGNLIPFRIQLRTQAGAAGPVQFHSDGIPEPARLLPLLSGCRCSHGVRDSDG